MKKMWTYLAVALCFGAALAGTFRGTAQRAGVDPPRIEARLSTDSVSIGDQFTVDVEVEKDLVQLVDFPTFFKEEGKPGLIGERVEVLAEYPVDTLAREGRNVRIRKRYLLTVFDAGIYNLGVFPALYMDKNVTDTLYSADSLRLAVHTFPIDTLTMQIHDIAPPMKAPILPGEWLGWAMLLFFGGQVIFALIYILRHRSRSKKAAARSRRRPDEPPHVTAIRELEKLQSEKLWQNQRHKLYYTRLTDIVREYIEGRYGVGAMEMTSDEITHAMTEINIPARSHEQIRRLLSTADYVKFAKYVPDAQDNEMSWSDAYYFVEETKILAADPDAGKEGML
jgi:hypothetical protein